MNRRFFRKIAFALVAAQLLCAPPVVNALAAMAPADSAGSNSHCAELMPAGGTQDECPCCPDGGMNVATCLSACMASVGWVPNLVFTAAPVIAGRLPPATHIERAALADPPLKPPPIA